VYPVIILSFNFIIIILRLYFPESAFDLVLISLILMHFVLFYSKRVAALNINSINFLLKLLVFAGLLYPFSSFGQVSSNEGTEFWVAFPTHEHDYFTDGTIALPNLSIFITSSQSSKGRVSVGTFSQSFTVAANNVTEIKIPREQSYIDISESGKTLPNRAVHITVDAGQPKIVVYAHIFAAQRSAASLIIPSEALGKSYASINFKSTGVGKNFITLVATQPNTKIHLLKGNKELIPGGVDLPNVNDIYEYISDDDLTGTNIVSDESQCASFAVFSGTSGSLISDGSCITKTIDPLYQQCYPTKSWGYTYGLIPFSTQSTHFNHPVRTTGYHIRVVASEDETHLTVNGTFAATLNSGDFYSSEQTGPMTGDSFIKADKPVSVAQYALSQSCSNQNAGSNTESYSDPDMVILNPIEYNIKRITIFSSSKENIKEQYVNVLIKTAAAPSFRINDQKPAIAFQPMKNLTGYSYLQLNLTNYPNHTFNLKADEGFNAIAYGFGNVESYAYSAGTNLASNYSLSTVRTSDNKLIDSACVNDDYFFRLTLPYASPKIIWQMDNTELPYTAINPAFIKTDHDGKVAYEYMLPKTPAYDNAGLHHIHIAAQYPANECSNTSVQNIQQDFKVNDLPNVRIAISKSDCQNIFTFGDQTPHPGNTEQRIWNFGDPADKKNNVAASQTAKHLYTRNGTYTVTLTVINVSGCQATKSDKVVVTGNTPVDFKVTSIGCIDKPVSFTYTPPSSTVLKPIIWKWYYGDGDSTINDKNQEVYHYYKSPGIYQARLVIVSEAGCLNYSDFKTVNIINPPGGDFTFQDVCSGSRANFIFKGTQADYEQINWNFGDSYATSDNPNLASSLQASHVYTHSGEYLVSLIISSGQGCEISIVKTIHVYSNSITADFMVENACAGQAVSFKNISKLVGYGTINKIEWYFEPESDPGKKETYTNPNVNDTYLHTFSSPASSSVKTVKLRVFTFADCFSEVTKSVKLSTVPNVSFSPIGEICEDAAPLQIIQGEETSGLEGDGYYSGAGITLTGLFDPAKAGPGYHQLTYNFISKDGCSNSASQQVTVLPKLTVTMPTDITIIQGETVTLKPVVSGSNLEFKWHPSTWLNYDNIAAPATTPAKNITYTLIATNGICTSQSTISVNVLKPIKPFNTFTPNADGINDLWTIENIEDHPKATIQIFNRYGTELYHSTGYGKPWNGKYRDREVPSGVYYYVITPGKNQDKIAGYITLLR
jgi:gliding motility-associated-like protein